MRTRCARRRTIYTGGEFTPYMVLAALAGSLILLAFLAFFFNIVKSVGLKGPGPASGPVPVLRFPGVTKEESR